MFAPTRGQPRIAIVEDEVDLAAELSRMLRRAFPTAVIHSASTILDFKELAARAQADDLPYNALILDDRVPANAGDPPSGFIMPSVKELGDASTKVILI